VPRGSKNFAFISQFVEIADDVVFTVEYSVRAAQMAVYELLGIDRKIPPVTPHAESVHAQFEALLKAFKSMLGPARRRLCLMSRLMSREIRLASRPSGIPTEANFTLAWADSEPLKDGEVLVRNLFMSVDPYMRGRMNEGKSYVLLSNWVKPLDGGAVGDVIESRAREFKPGECRHFQLRMAGVLRCFARGLASGQPWDSAALGLPSARSHDGHDPRGLG